MSASGNLDKYLKEHWELKYQINKGGLGEKEIWNWSHTDSTQNHRNRGGQEGKSLYEPENQLNSVHWTNMNYQVIILFSANSATV